MASVRWERLAAATGIAFVALFVVGAILIGGAGGDTDDPAQVVSQRLLDNDTNVYLGGALVGVAGAALVWFAGSLRTTLRRAEGGSGRLSAVAFGAAAVQASLLVTAATLGTAAVFELADFQNSAETARAFYAVSGTLALLGTTLPFGVMLASASVVALRTGVLPRWLAWPGAVVGVLMALGWLIWPIAVFGHLLALLWTLITSIILVRRAGTTETLVDARGDGSPRA